MSRRPIWLRAGLLYLAYVNLSVGLWATVAPRSFYEDFPGAGRVWVATDGPFNEHLVRDVGAWSLGMAVVVVAALWTLSRPLVVTAGAAMAVLALPHAIYHSFHADLLGSGLDQALSIGGLYLAVAVGLAVAVAALRSGPVPAPD
ncbi:MAG: hypothetical protein M3527_02875 [Actinomycetota bacterium]|nr:hypothetical protein [Acidimicrobiia bacterium]MDQ3293382.1 hypothetical protein [Actinomycetota bacterium]